MEPHQARDAPKAPKAPEPPGEPTVPPLSPVAPQAPETPGRSPPRGAGTPQPLTSPPGRHLAPRPHPPSPPRSRQPLRPAPFASPRPFSLLLPKKPDRAALRELTPIRGRGPISVSASAREPSDWRRWRAEAREDPDSGAFGSARPHFGRARVSLGAGQRSVLRGILWARLRCV